MITTISLFREENNAVGKTKDMTHRCSGCYTHFDAETQNQKSEEA